jgi:tetratricopeptide (TPR) repeat protein
MRVKLAASSLVVLLTAAAPLAAPSFGATSYYQEGLKLLKAERYPEAVAAFEKEAAENPGSAEVLMNLGWSYWKVNRIDDAWRCFDLLAKLDPKNATYLRFLAETEVTRKEFPHALEHSEEALKLLPGDKDASIVMSSALIGLKRHNEADRILRDLVERYPDSGPVQFHMADNLAAMGRLDESLKHFDILMHLAPENGDYRRARANVMYALGQEDAAVAEWKALADRTPPDQKSLINLGWDAAKRRDFDGAWAYGKRLLRLDPKNPTYMKFVGNVQLERGDGVDALRLAQRALDALGPDKDASLLKAKALFLLMRDKEATAVLTALLKSYPDDRQIVFNMADFLQAMGRGQESLVFYDRLIKMDPENLVYRYRRADVYYELGDFDTAMAEWKAITAKYPAEVKGLNAMTADALSRNAYDEALLYMQEKALRQPLDAEGWQTLIGVYAKLKSYPLAIAAADKALKLDPSNQGALFEKAEILEGIGDYNASEAVYRQLLERNPNSLRALSALGRIAEMKGDYPRAIRLVHSLRKLSFSDSTSSPYLDILEARLLADSGHIEKGMHVLHKKATKKRISIPVLLYHGVSRFARGDREQVPQARFAQQMEAVKKAGYEPISVAQLSSYWGGKGALPDKPILITFDDARADAFNNGDPILEREKMKATMFVHLTGGFKRNRYYASGPQIDKWNKTGRWEIQGHSYQAHESVPVDRFGHKGHFLSNRRWLEDKHRLETTEEFRARLDADFKGAREHMEAMFPGRKIEAYAFPFGDMGQTDFTNAPEAPTYNWQSVHKYYKFSFTQDAYGFNRVPTKITDLSRWEIQRDYTVRDIMHHLTMEEPWIKAKMLEADFWIRTDQPGRSLSIYRMLRTKYGVQDGALYGGEALAFDMFGNGYVARKKWKKANEQDPGNDKYRELAAFSAARDTPRLGSNGQYFSDPYTHNTSVRAAYSQPIMAARVEPFIGRSMYSQNGLSSLSANEVGATARWFPLPRVRLDGDYTSRKFVDGDRRVTQSGNGQMTFPFFAPFRLGIKGGVNDVATRQGAASKLFYRDYGGLGQWDVAMNTALTADYEIDNYNDTNRQSIMTALLSRRFAKFFTIGYGFRYMQTAFASPDYWSPRRSQMNTGSIGVNGTFGPIDTKRNIHLGSGSLQYSGGYGSEDGRNRFVQGIKGTLGYRLFGGLSALISAGYSQSPTYTSRTLGAGIGLDL